MGQVNTYNVSSLDGRLIGTNLTAEQVRKRCSLDERNIRSLAAGGELVTGEYRISRSGTLSLKGGSSGWAANFAREWDAETALLRSRIIWVREKSSGVKDMNVKKRELV